MMVGINGPPLRHWNATKYVVSWLQSGKHEFVGGDYLTTPSPILPPKPEF